MMTPSYRTLLTDGITEQKKSDYPSIVIDLVVEHVKRDVLAAGTRWHRHQAFDCLPKIDSSFQ